MIDLGTVRPGSTIRIPFSSFDKDDGSSITMTNYAVADILIYKDGSTTERASTSGFTATTDFDSKTGKHLAVIDLSDNTTAGFYNAGSEYLVAIDAVTVDGVTVGGWIARFRIGYAGAMLDTTVATLSSQTSFTLTSGPADNSALVGMQAVVHSVASGVQCSRVIITAYTGSTKTVTLAAGATFTLAAGDNISVLDLAPLQPTTLNRTITVSSTGAVDGGIGGSQLSVTEIVKDTTSFTDYFVLVDAVTGQPKTGLVYTDITGSYTRAVTARAAITMATLAAANTAWSSGGFKEIDATNCPGLYRLDIPDAALATGVDKVVVTLKATGVKTENRQYVLTAWNKQIASIPNVASAAAGGLITRGTGAGQLNVTGGRADADVLYWNAASVHAPDAAGYPVVTVKSGTGTGELSLSAGIIQADVTKWLTVAPSALQSGRVDGYIGATAAALTFALTGNITGSLSGSVGSVTGAVGSVTGNVGGSVGSVTGLTVPTNFGSFALDSSGRVILQPTQAGVTIPTVTTLTNAPSDTAGTTTLLGRLTSTRASNLDNLDAAITTRLASASYTAPNNAGISSAATSAAAAAVSAAAVDSRLPASPAAVGDEMTLDPAEYDLIAAGLLDLANGVETSVTVRKALRAMAAVLVGKVTGAQTDVESFFAIGNDSTPRVVGHADADGNRVPTTTL